MKIRKIKKGSKSLLPCGSWNEDEKGWSTAIEAKESGVVVTFNARETIVGGAFVPDTELRKLGYYYKKPVTKKPKKND